MGDLEPDFRHYHCTINRQLIVQDLRQRVLRGAAGSLLRLAPSPSLTPLPSPVHISCASFACSHQILCSRIAGQPRQAPWRDWLASPHGHCLLQPLFLEVAPQLIGVVGCATQQPFTIHLPLRAQQEAPQPTPLLALTEYRLDDRLAPGVDLLSLSVGPAGKTPGGQLTASHSATAAAGSSGPVARGRRSCQ